MGFAVRALARIRRPLVVAATLCVGLAAPAAAQVAFSPPVSLGLASTSSTYTAVATGDVNRDGHTDIVVLDKSGGLSVLLGDGHGGYRLQTIPAATREGAESVILADMNGDGMLDLVIGNAQAHTVSVLLGDGQGGFVIGMELALGPSGPGPIAVGDLNGDGKPDLVVGILTNPGQVAVLLADGAGGFGPRMDLTPAEQPTAVVLGDLNRDGRLDIVTGGSLTGSLSIFLGDGHGGFGPRTDRGRAGGGPVASLAIADVDGDGKPDVVAAVGISPASIVTYLGDGAGGLMPPVEVVASGIPRTLAIADFNGDGRLDVAYSTAGAAGVLLGNGTAALGPSVAFSTGSADDQRTGAIALIDDNGDGRPDLVAINHVPADVVLLRNTPPSVWFTRGVTVPLGDFPNVPRGVFTADFNQDGNVDLAFAKSAAGVISIFLGDGAGGFVPAPDVVTLAGANLAAVGDFTRDGRADLIVTAGSTISIFPGVGNGTFGSRLDLVLDGDVRSVAVVDVDGDGNADLVVAYVSLPSITVVLGNGAGGIKTRRDVPLPVAARGVVPVHVNLDGRIDLVVGTFPSVTVLLGDGTGQFPERIDIPAPADTFGVDTFAVGDVSGDGRPDLVVAAARGRLGFSTGTVLLGDGAGRFSPVTSFQPAAGSIRIVDVDGDGKADLVFARGSDVSVQRGNGAGGFAAGILFPTNVVFTTDLAVADVTHDLKPDIVLGTTSSNTITTLVNASSAGGVGLWPNQSRFAPGDTLVSTIELVSQGLPGVADIYLGAVLPDGDTVVFFTDPAFSSFATGRLSSPATFRPFASGVDLSTPFSMSRVAAALHHWTGVEPRGTYLLFLAVARAGSFADGRIDPGDILRLSVTRLDFDS